MPVLVLRRSDDLYHFIDFVQRRQKTLGDMLIHLCFLKIVLAPDAL